MTITVETEKQLPAVVEESYRLQPALTATEAKSQLAQLQEFVRGYLVEGQDYGVQPGTQQKTLFKAGADKLCEIYQFFASYELEHVERNYESGLFDFEYKCTLTDRNGRKRGEGLGSCSTYESKYRYRTAQRSCPECGAVAIIKGNAEYGGGWLCWKKKDGCGIKYQSNDSRITGQEAGKVQNENLADQKNTVMKMAKKRAYVDAVIAVTRSSDLFTQDVGDPEIEAVVVDTSTGEVHGPLATPRQRQELLQFAKECGWTDKQLIHWMAKQWSQFDVSAAGLKTFDKQLDAKLTVRMRDDAMRHIQNFNADGSPFVADGSKHLIADEEVASG